MKNKIVLFITFIVCFLLQCTIMDYISIGSITPNLPLILCVAMGLMRGRKVGLWTGFFSGLFIDLFYGSLFGFYALIYMYAGYISGYAFRSFYDDDLKVPLFLVAGTDLLYNLSVYGLQFLLHSLNVLAVLAHTAGGEILLQVLDFNQRLVFTHSAFSPFSNAAFCCSQQ